MKATDLIDSVVEGNSAKDVVIPLFEGFRWNQIGDIFSRNIGSNVAQVIMYKLGLSPGVDATVGDVLKALNRKVKAVFSKIAGRDWLKIQVDTDGSVVVATNSEDFKREVDSYELY